MSRQVKIIGGGFSGLSLGYFLSKINVPVHIYEKSQRVGGLIESKKFSWGLAESAATGYLNSKLFQAVTSDLGIELATPTDDKKKRYIFRDGLKRWPLRALETARFTLGLSQAWLGFNTARVGEGETMRSWVERNLGPAAFEFLAGPALQGIYSSQDLSAQVVLNSLKSKSNFSKPAKRGTMAPVNGMQEITDGLARKIKELGGKIFLNAETDIDHVRPVVLAVPSKVAAVLLAPDYADLAKVLARIDYLPLTTVTAVFDRAAPHLRGFGCLFPPSQGFESLGVLANSFIFAERGNEKTVIETWIFAGVEKSNLLARLKKDRAKLLGIEQSSDVLDFDLTSWPAGIPHYNQDLNFAAQHVISPRGIYITGNYLGKIGLTKILETNYFLAQKIKSEL